jgi:hypothetical protein
VITPNTVLTDKDVFQILPSSECMFQLSEKLVLVYFYSTSPLAADGLLSSPVLVVVPKRQEARSCSVIKTIVSYRSVLSIISSVEALRYMGVAKERQLFSCM